MPAATLANVRQSAVKPDPQKVYTLRLCPRKNVFDRHWFSYFSKVTDSTRTLGRQMFVLTRMRYTDQAFLSRNEFRDLREHLSVLLAFGEIPVHCLFLPDLPSRLPPCIRPAATPWSRTFSWTVVRQSPIVLKSPVFDLLSPCVTVCGSFRAHRRVAAAFLDAPCPGTAVPEFASDDHQYCATWNDGSRARPSRPHRRPSAIWLRRRLAHQEPGGSRGTTPSRAAD